MILCIIIGRIDFCFEKKKFNHETIVFKKVNVLSSIMAIRVYQRILEKAEVDKFYGNEEKIRKILLGVSTTELSKEAEASLLAAHITVSLLREPSYNQKVFVKRLYETETPVTYEVVKRGTTASPIPLPLLEEMGIIKTDWVKEKGEWGYKSRKTIVEINKPLMKRYWSNIEKFPIEYRKRQSIQRKRQGYGVWVDRARIVLKDMRGGLTEKNIKGLSSSELDTEEHKFPRTYLANLKKELIKKLKNGEL